MLVLSVGVVVVTAAALVHPLVAVPILLAWLYVFHAPDAA